MKITWLGHSSFLLEGKKVSLVFDPYQNDSVPGLTFPENISAQCVLVSHNHFDHNAVDSVHLLDTDENLVVSDFEVYHDKQNGKVRGMSKVHVVFIDGYKVVHLGDIGYPLNEEQIFMIKDADILFAPINGYYTLGAQEIVDIVKKSNPKMFIPMHYNYGSVGYKDGMQINKLRKLLNNIWELPGYELDIPINKALPITIIFSKALGER